MSSSHSSNLEIEGVVVSINPLIRDSKGRKLFAVYIQQESNPAHFSQDLKIVINRIRVNFYDEWAEACSFIAISDSVNIRNFSAVPSDNTPFEICANPKSQLTVKRQRCVAINSTNVASFEYHEEVMKQLQTHQTLLLRGHNQFTHCASFYDALYGSRENQARFAWILAILQKNFIKSVLDLGCGTGLFSFYLAQNSMNVTGVDSSDALLDIAKQKNNSVPDNQKIPFHRDDLADFKFVNEKTSDALPKFDCILCLDSLQFLTEWSRVRLAIRNFRSHLNENGFVVLDVPNYAVTDKQQPSQTSLRIELSRQNLCSLGSPCLLDEGTLDVIQRVFKEKGFRSNEWFGFSQQLSGSRKIKFYTNWVERFDELIFNLQELESLIEVEGFMIQSTYGDQLGADFDYRISPRCVMLLKRKSLANDS